MGFWSNLFAANGDDITPNATGPATFHGGDPEGIELIGDPLIEQRALPIPLASPWDGWPSNWDTPNWQINTGLSRLVDIAWACLDLNSNVVSAMPVYQLKNGQIIPPETWMSNPDPTIYTCWQEFAKQLFWDYQMGEAFVLPFSTGSDGKPAAFRVIPPWLVTVELIGGMRQYFFAGHDVTDEILHIRYCSNTISPRGLGPLEVAGARMTNIKLLQRYTNTLAETGGVPLYWLGVERRLTQGEAKDLLATWMETRSSNPAAPAIVGSNAKLNQAQQMNAKDMALLELSEFSESRIAILLGVPPSLVALTGGGGSSGRLVYSNVTDLFDFHDRSSLRPKTRMVMQSLSNWALPNGRSVEVNRDDYTRLPFDKRVQAYKTLIDMEVLTADEVRIMERFYGSSAGSAAQALTGGANQ